MKKDKFKLIGITEVDGYERYAAVKGKKSGQELYIHFLQRDEYLEKGGTSLRLKPGDKLKGTLSIELAQSAEITCEESGYTQAKQGYPDIAAVAEVVKVLNRFDVMCKIDGFPHKIPVAFESEICFKDGDRIKFEGSLELDIIA